MRSMTYLLMALMVMGLLAADFFVLTSSSVVEGLAEQELRKVFGDALTYEGIDASLDGLIQLRGVELRVADKPGAPVFLKCPMLSIMLDGSRTAQIHLEHPEFFLTPEVGDALRIYESRLPEGSRTEPLPQVTCTGGKVRFGDLSPLLSRKTPWFAIEKFALHPLETEGFYVRGQVEDQNRNRWIVGGELDLARRRLSMKIRLQDLSLADLSAMLPDTIQAEWSRWNPQGRATIDLDLTTSDTNDPTALAMVVNLEDLSLQYQTVKVEHLKGEVRGTVVGNEAGKEPHVHFTVDLRTQDLATALPGGGKVRVRGTIEQIDDAVPFELTFELSDAPIEAMKGALPAEHAALWDEVAPAGRVTLGGTVTHEGASLVKAEILEASATAGQVGRVEGLQGRVELSGDTINIVHLEGRQGPAAIEVRGTISGALASQTDPQLSLKATARRMPIARFVEVAKEYEIHEIVQPWDGETFEDAGDVDLEMSLEGPSGAPKVDMLVMMRGNRLAYGEIPLPLKEVTGRIRVNKERTEVEYVTALYPAPTGNASPVAADTKDATVRVHGWNKRTTKTPHAQYRVELQKVRINEAFSSRLPDEVRRIVEAMKLEGDANILTDVWVRGTGDESSIDFNCELRMFGATLNPGLKLENVTGSILLDGASFTEGSTVVGSLNFSEATIEGHRLSNLHATFTVWGSTLSFGHISANAYGGGIEASVSVNTRTGDFRGDFYADRIDLKELSNAIAGYSERGLAGIASLQKMTLRGKLGDKSTFRGSGTMTVDEAHLWGVPVMMKLFSLNLNEVFQDQPSSLRGKMTFDIRDSKMVIDDLRLDEEDLEIVGRGKIQMDGAIDLILKTNSDMLGVHIPGISDLLELAKGEIQAWRATGTFDEPELNLRFFPGLASPEE